MRGGVPCISFLRQAQDRFFGKVGNIVVILNRSKGGPVIPRLPIARGRELPEIASEGGGIGRRPGLKIL